MHAACAAACAGDVSHQEPMLVQRLARGAKGLHVLSLAPTQEPEVCIPEQQHPDLAPGSCI